MEKIMFGFDTEDFLVHIETEKKRNRFSSYQELVKYVVEQNKQYVNYNQEGYTPLHSAIIEAQLTLVKTLIEYGAKVDEVISNPSISRLYGNHTLEVAQNCVEKHKNSKAYGEFMDIRYIDAKEILKLIEQIYEKEHLEHLIDDPKINKTYKV
jgi:ankyrin repeat protein